MLPEEIWNMPRFGTFNLHASLLPQYRGAAPINWAIINGEKETGVTTFFLNHDIDTGNVIMNKQLLIADTDDAEIVHDNLMNMGAGLVTETVDLLLKNDGKPDTIPQKRRCSRDMILYPAPKLFNDTCRIEWNQSAKKIYDFIRGLSPYPAAWTELVAQDGICKLLKIYQSEVLNESHSLMIGSIRSSDGYYLDVAVPDGFVRLLSVQLAGKKRLSIRDFLNGNKQLIGIVR